MTLEEQARHVTERAELVALLTKLVEDLKANPDDWENANLSSFLTAMGAWMSDMDGYYENVGQDPSVRGMWGVFADILMAARVYE